MARSSPLQPPWRWAALLGFALLGPISLPAGGGERRQPEVRRRSAGDPLLAVTSDTLSSSPRMAAPSVGQLSPGEPLRVVRAWRSPADGSWLQVSGRSGRGWLPLYP